MNVYILKNVHFKQWLGARNDSEDKLSALPAWDLGFNPVQWYCGTVITARATSRNESEVVLPSIP